jgi:hypothetical protein
MSKSSQRKINKVDLSIAKELSTAIAFLKVKGAAEGDAFKAARESMGLEEEEARGLLDLLEPEQPKPFPWCANALQETIKAIEKKL